jgi:hypothetical protein
MIQRCRFQSERSCSSGNTDGPLAGLDLVDDVFNGGEFEDDVTILVLAVLRAESAKARLVDADVVELR